jgi:tripartite-type tricarboxylate transporter receptor subunit TctC
MITGGTEGFLMTSLLRKISSGMTGWVLFLLILVAMLLPASSQSAQTEEFPTKPIQNIVSWAGGGSSEMSQRLIANYITQYLGQPMVVVLQPGGAGVPGTASIGTSKNDGYTIGMNWYASFVLRPYLLQVPYKIEDYTIILGMVRQRLVVAVRADSPFKTLNDLIDFAKKNPKKLICSGGPTATWQLLASNHLNQIAGIETRFVPYDGGRPAAVAMLGGHVDYIVALPTDFSPELKSGQFRVLAALENERIPKLPDVPTATELGYKVAHPHMMIIIGPAGIPADRVKKIHDAYKAVMADKGFLKSADDMELEVEYRTGEEVKKEMLQLDAEFKVLIPTLFKK